MSDHINILTEDMIGKIAAGEVVERPRSVVKELIENSIDAGADSIEIEVQAAGQSLIRVADNGKGMSENDAKIACIRHTTSKIRKIEDLDNIRSLGFRGEALASIAAVSQMDIVTSTGEASGVYLYLESGEILSTKPAGRPRGTTVEVRNLFYNVPARKKFLKSESTELAEIAGTVGRFILSNPDIEIKLTHDGRSLLHTHKMMDIKDRLRLVIGSETADNMFFVEEKTGGYSLDGFLSKPASTRKDRRGQIFFINGRYVKNRTINNALYEGYRTMLERGRFPAAVLFFQIPTDEIDVNVHPAKLEVKFQNEPEVRSLIAGTIYKGFEKIKEMETKNSVFKTGEAGTQTSETPDHPVLKQPQVQDEFFNTEKSAEEGWGAYSKMPYLRSGKTPEKDFVRPKDELRQIGGCYIVRFGEKEIFVTDQHAAHERIMYEFFTKAVNKGASEKQNLLFPETLDLSKEEAIVMEKMIGDFSTIGFDIEPFGSDAYIIQSVPGILKERSAKEIVRDILTDIGEMNLSRISIIDELIKIASCRAAIKAGDLLNEEEMRSLLEQLNKCDLPFTCPHGRPTMIDITVDELEKRFRRK